MNFGNLYCFINERFRINEDSEIYQQSKIKRFVESKIFAKMLHVLNIRCDPKFAPAIYFEYFRETSIKCFYNNTTSTLKQRTISEGG